MILIRYLRTAVISYLRGAYKDGALWRCGVFRIEHEKGWSSRHPTSFLPRGQSLSPGRISSNSSRRRRPRRPSMVNNSVRRWRERNTHAPVSETLRTRVNRMQRKRLLLLLEAILSQQLMLLQWNPTELNERRRRIVTSRIVMLVQRLMSSLR